MGDVGLGGQAGWAWGCLNDKLDSLDVMESLL